MFEALAGIGAAFGLSGSAGLNAYIPLLIVGVAARYPLNNPLIDLAEPYSLLSNPWIIFMLSILLIIEMLADKIPVVDSINDGIQTFIRPAAGAILFAGSANVITDISPIITLGAGLLTSGGVHATKSLARPIVTATTGGTGNWIVSILEDVVAFFVSIFALLIPIITGILVVIGLFFGVRTLRQRKKKKDIVFNS
ncbi:MAG: DUF4126 domain-containing protein [Anaerolineae bacterium]|nr:DUF4126 domain-containing protein [Anaerolineae bacterium]